MDWESVYTMFTLFAIGIGCYACFVPETQFRFTINYAIFVYLLGIVMSYFQARNIKKHKEDEEWLS